MDYARPALADRLAAGYVVGTLRGAARRRFESLLPAHALLREAMQAWQERLMPLTVVLAPVQPSAAVWRRISERIAGDAKRSDVQAGFWHRLGAWRAFSAVASVAAIALAVLLANPRPSAPPVIVVLASTQSAPGGASPAASLVASISGDRKTLVTRAINPVAAEPDRSLELWAVPPGGAPRPLGLLPQGRGTIALRGTAITGADTLAVSVEPPGGSPTGAPTGPIIYAGKVQP